ncbi:hypothetical protein KDA14_02895 [Candidatus Saccharibacteria bacterium]|nr:hypothetical protein [Candidatus Saccharibacteria bacterium]
MGIGEKFGRMFGSGEPELSPEELYVLGQARHGYAQPAGSEDVIISDLGRIDDITDNGVENRRPEIADGEPVVVVEEVADEKPSKPGKLSAADREELKALRAAREAERAERRAATHGGDEEDIRVASPRVTASYLSGTARDRLRDTSSTARLIAGGSAALLVLGGTYATFAPASADPEKCDDLTHMSVGSGNKAFGGFGVGIADAFSNKNRSWTEVAETVETQRGYVVSPEALAMANRKLKNDGKKVVKMDTKTTPQDGLNIEGNASLCLNLPAPIEPGFASLDGTVSAADFMEQYELSEERFAKLNPNFAADPGKTLKAGTVLRYEFNSPEVRGRYVLQIVPDGGLDKVAKGDKKVSKKDLYGLNWPFIEEHGEAPKAGEEAFLPADEFMVNGKKVSYKEIRAAYHKPGKK